MDIGPRLPEAPQTDRLTRILRWVVGLIVVALVIGVALVGLAYAASPEAIRHPGSSHFHFRLQIISGGQSVNFAQDAFQTDFNKDICTAKLTKEPFHFHDHLDQFVHVHWTGMTGGLLLKNYGWNKVGGLPGVLGYRFDALPRLASVPIHGSALPQPPANAHYYIYTGDSTSYKEQDWQKFLTQDLEAFFGQKKAATLLDRLIPAASAHGDTDESQLIQLNHVVGNAVIFVQADRPTSAQIQDRFNHLIDLPESSCGG